MENNLESIVLILEQLKNLKIPASKIEKDLGFSNGLLKKGKLSQGKWERLLEYWKKHCNANYQTFQEIEEICNKEGITPQELVKQWKEGSLKNGNWNEAVKARKMEKELDHEKFIEKYGNNSFIEIDRELNKPNTNTGLSKWQLELRKKKIGI